MKKTSNALDLLRENSISKELYRCLSSAGLNRNLCDLIIAKRAMFAILSDSVVVRCAIFRHILNLKEYKQNGAPNLHIAMCDDLAKEELNDGTFKVCTKNQNSFSFVVRDKNEEVKRSLDVELQICPKCLEIAKKRFSFLEFTQSTKETLEDEVDCEIVSTFYKKFKHLTCNRCNKRVSLKEVESLKLLFFDDNRYVKNAKRLELVCLDCLNEGYYR